MILLNKIFTIKTNTEKLNNYKNTPDIEKLLNSGNNSNLIYELIDYINRLCIYGKKINILNQCQKIFFYNQSLEMEVNNGGFNQFFSNISGSFAHETVDSLKIIGANKTAEILSDAIAQFPENKVPKKQSERNTVLEKIEYKADLIWYKLDEQFYNYEDDLESLNADYIKQNKENFI
jgi:hypothetical protein